MKLLSSFKKHTQLQVFLAFFITLFLDQITKLGVMYLPFVEIQMNEGVSFGLFPSQWLIIVLIIAITILYWWSCDLWSRVSPLSRGIFFGAAVSNLVDRIALGGVRDWIFIPVLGLSNNLADWFLFLALLWFGVQWAHEYTLNINSRHSL